MTRTGMAVVAGRSVVTSDGAIVVGLKPGGLELLLVVVVGFVELSRDRLLDMGVDVEPETGEGAVDVIVAVADGDDIVGDELS